LVEKIRKVQVRNLFHRAWPRKPDSGDTVASTVKALKEQKVSGRECRVKWRSKIEFTSTEARQGGTKTRHVEEPFPKGGNPSFPKEQKKRGKKPAWPLATPK